MYTCTSKVRMQALGWTERNHSNHTHIYIRTCMYVCIYMETSDQTQARQHRVTHKHTLNTQQGSSLKQCKK